MSRVELLRHCPKESCAHLGHAGEWEALREGGAGEGGGTPIKKRAPIIQKECPKWIKDAFWKGCSAGYPLGSKARPVVGAAAILRIYKQGRLLV